MIDVDAVTSDSPDDDDKLDPSVCIVTKYGKFWVKHECLNTIDAYVGNYIDSGKTKDCLLTLDQQDGGRISILTSAIVVFFPFDDEMYTKGTYIELLENRRRDKIKEQVGEELGIQPEPWED